MLVLEYKLVADEKQQTAIEEAIRTSQFIRNKALRLWKDTNAKPGIRASVGESESLLRRPRQRVLLPQQTQLPGTTGSSRTSRSCHQSLHQTGWKLSEDRKRITFTDGIGIGKMKMLGLHSCKQGTQDLTGR